MEKIMEERTDSRRYDMFTVLFTILTFIVFGKLLIFAIKASWGLARILVTVLFLPFVMIGLVVAGFFFCSSVLTIIAGVFF